MSTEQTTHRNFMHVQEKYRMYRKNAERRQRHGTDNSVCNPCCSPSSVAHLFFSSLSAQPLPLPLPSLRLPAPPLLLPFPQLPFPPLPLPSPPLPLLYLRLPVHTARWQRQGGSTGQRHSPLTRQTRPQVRKTTRKKNKRHKRIQQIHNEQNTEGRA